VKKITKKKLYSAILVELLNLLGKDVYALYDDKVIKTHVEKVIIFENGTIGLGTKFGDIHARYPNIKKIVLKIENYNERWYLTQEEAEMALKKVTK
jgi:hypothetical protein